MSWRLQPYVAVAATVCSRGCNLMYQRLQRIRGCDRMQPKVSGQRSRAWRLLLAKLRAAGAVHLAEVFKGPAQGAVVLGVLVGAPHMHGHAGTAIVLARVA